MKQLIDKALRRRKRSVLDVLHANRRWVYPLAAGAAAAGAYATYRLITGRKAAGPGPMTPATSNDHAADHPIGPPGDNIDDRLDEALQESFPTSDPVSIEVR